MEKTGLAIMRLQPLHKAHVNLINQMNSYCETSIIGLGSAQVNNEWNPFTVEQRTKMLKNVFGDRIKIVPLTDINTEKGTDEWINYVVDKINKIGMSTPTDYFSGSEADSVWYKNYFGKNLHIMPREMFVHPSASEVRTLLAAGDTAWQKYIPRVNWNIVNNYPEKFKL